MAKRVWTPKYHQWKVLGSLTGGVSAEPQRTACLVCAFSKGDALAKVEKHYQASDLAFRASTVKQMPDVVEVVE